MALEVATGKGEAQSADWWQGLVQMLYDMSKRLLLKTKMVMATEQTMIAFDGHDSPSRRLPRDDKGSGSNKHPEKYVSSA